MKALLIPGRRAAVMAAAVATVAASLAFVPVATAQAQTTSCLTVDSAVTVWSTSPDSGGFTHTITLTNVCAEPVNGWTVRLALPPGQTVHHNWSAVVQILDDQVTFTPAGWNTVINPSGSTSFGFVGSWVGTYQDPLSCTINGVPCDGEAGNQPPEVVQTSPVGLVGILSPCGLTFAAAASDPDGAIDRVEFFVNGVLAGTDDTAPYLIRSNSVPTPPPISADNVAFARAFDTGVPQLSTDSEPVRFRVAVSDLPPDVVFPCLFSLTLPAGSSEEIRFAVSPSTVVDELTLTVTGDPGVTVSSPATAIPSGFQATVSAAEGAAGATATITATAQDLDPATMSITVG